jgi:hypothetical protein
LTSEYIKQQQQQLGTHIYLQSALLGIGSDASAHQSIITNTLPCLQLLL